MLQGWSRSCAANLASDAAFPRGSEWTAFSTQGSAVEHKNHFLKY